MQALEAALVTCANQAAATAASFGLAEDVALAEDAARAARAEGGGPQLRFVMINHDPLSFMLSAAGQFLAEGKGTRFASWAVMGLWGLSIAAAVFWTHLVRWWRQQ